MSIDAMKQVLAAWESGDLRNLGACIPALRAAIEQEPVSLNEGRLTRYADGSIGVGTPENPEPVAWRYALDASIEGPRWIYIDCDPSKWLTGPASVKALIEPLYTAPRLWQGLTDEEIEQCCYEADSKAADHPQTWKWTEAFARAIEAKLKEKNT